MPSVKMLPYWASVRMEEQSAFKPGGKESKGGVKKWANMLVTQLLGPQTPRT